MLRDASKESDLPFPAILAKIIKIPAHAQVKICISVLISAIPNKDDDYEFIIPASGSFILKFMYSSMSILPLKDQ